MSTGRSSRAASLRDLAWQNNRDVGGVSRTLPLAFLEPAIVEAIIEGRQPIGLTPRMLKRIGMLPGERPRVQRCRSFGSSRMTSAPDAAAIGRFPERFRFSVPIQLERRGVEAKLASMSRRLLELAAAHACAVGRVED
jgi:hypothetical protein